MDLLSAFRSAIGNATSSRGDAAGTPSASPPRMNELVTTLPAISPSRSHNSNLSPDLNDEIGRQLTALSGDVNMQSIYYLTLMLLRKTNPDAVEGFVKSMHDALSLSSAPPAATAEPVAQPQLEQAVTEGVLSTLSVHVEQMSASVSFTDSESGTVFSATLSTLRIDIEARITALQQPRQVAPAAPQDPLTLDLNGNGRIDLGRTRTFDLAGQGDAGEIPFVSGGDAFLALDRDGNGRIDNGTELFGDQHGAANGFDELAKFDRNGDGRIDASDDVYARLRLLGDFNGDGADELKRLSEAGVTRIDLGYRNVSEAIAPRATMAQAGQFWRGEQEGLAGALLLQRV